jgi:hypothetical protein
MNNNYRLMPLIACLIGCAVLAEASLPNQSNYLNNGESSAVASTIRAGFAQLRQKNYMQAAQLFRAALAEPKDDLPNYESNIPLAFSLCRTGMRKEGRRILQDAECMINVDVGHLSCPTSHGDASFIAKKGTEKCYLLMCGEMYIPNYGIATKEQAAHFEALNQDLELTKEICRK